MSNSNGGDRPESYPKPTETDTQLQNQPEYIDQEPNTFQKEISDVPESPSTERSETPGSGAQPGQS